MGRKRIRARKHFPFYLACLIFLGLSSCAPMRQALTEANIYMELRETRALMQKGNFITARENNQKILAKSGRAQRHDAALFNLGLIHAHFANPEKDYKKSIAYFKKLIKEHPQSPLNEEAKIWISIFDIFHEITNITMEKFAKGAYAGLHLDQSLLSMGNFDAATKKNEGILSRTDGLPPADAALYNLGLVYAHSANPKKDFKKTINYFRRLVQEFPHSPLGEEAKIWLGLFETIEKMQQVDLEIEEKKKELTQ